MSSRFAQNWSHDLTALQNFKEYVKFSKIRLLKKRYRKIWVGLDLKYKSIKISTDFYTIKTKIKINHKGNLRNETRLCVWYDLISIYYEKNIIHFKGLAML